MANIITTARLIFRNGGKAIAEKLGTEAKALGALAERYSETHDNREAIAASAKRLALQAETLIDLNGEDPVVLDERQAFTAYRLCVSDGITGVRTWIRPLVSGEEGAKTALKRISQTVKDLSESFWAFRERTDDRSKLVAQVEGLRKLVLDFQVIEPRMAWNVGLAVKALDTLLWLLKQDIPTTTAQPPTEVRHINRLRDEVGRELDVLWTYTLAVGDPVLGGREELKPILAKLKGLQKIVSSDSYSDLPDPESFVATLQEIPTDVEALRTVRSPVTGGAAYMLVALPAITAKVEKVVTLLGRSPLAPRRGLIPIVSQRQVASRSAREFAFEV